MICNAVQKLIDYAVKNELITSDDIWILNLNSLSNELLISFD